MATFRDLLSAATAEITEIDTATAAERIAESTGDIAPTPVSDNYYVKMVLELGPLGL